MNYKTKIAFALAVFFLSIFCCGVAAAQGTNCPIEPFQNAPIYDGQTYIGSNCNLYSPGDVDSFIFDAVSGETYHLGLGINGAAPVNICMALYDPNFTKVFSGCTSIGFPNYQNAVVLEKMLATTGTYTVVVTENSSGTIAYALTLERLYPFSPDAQRINLSMLTNGNISPITAVNEFTFGVATTGQYLVSGTVPGNASSNICLRVYQVNGTAVQNDVCTSIGFPNYTNTVSVMYTPSQNGLDMALFWVAGNDGTQAYTLEASCYLGQCPNDPIPGLAGYLLLGGTPLANQLVGLVTPGPGGETTTTDANGYFQFVTVPKGNFTVYAPISAQDNEASAESVHSNPDR